MKTTIALTNGNFELELHGVIHVSKNNQYSGCVEFKSGKDITYEMVQSAIDNTVEYFGPDCTAEDIVEIGNGIRRIMKPKPLKLTNAQMGLIYGGLACGACLCREKGHMGDLKEFQEVMNLIDALRISDFNFEIVPE